MKRLLEIVKFLNGQRNRIDIFQKNTKMSNKHKKRYLTSLDVGGIQAKITIKYHFAPPRVTIIKKQVIKNAGKDVEKLEP